MTPDTVRTAERLRLAAYVAAYSARLRAGPPPGSHANALDPETAGIVGTLLDVIAHAMLHDLCDIEAGWPVGEAERREIVAAEAG